MQGVRKSQYEDYKNNGVVVLVNVSLLILNLKMHCYGRYTLPAVTQVTQYGNMSNIPIQCTCIMYSFLSEQLSWVVTMGAEYY